MIAQVFEGLVGCCQAFQCQQRTRQPAALPDAPVQVARREENTQPPQESTAELRPQVVLQSGRGRIVDIEIFAVQVRDGAVTETPSRAAKIAMNAVPENL